MQTDLEDSVIARLQDRVPDLSGRIEGAAHLAQLQAQNLLPKVTPAANVISTGLQGGVADAAAGLFRQSFDETIGVILTFRNTPGKGARALDKIASVKRAVIEAICGWAPDDVVGVFRLVRGAIVSFAGGTLVYQIEFAVGDQLRIMP